MLLSACQLEAGWAAPRAAAAAAAHAPVEHAKLACTRMLNSAMHWHPLALASHCPRRVLGRPGVTVRFASESGECQCAHESTGKSESRGPPRAAPAGASQATPHLPVRALYLAERI